MLVRKLETLTCAQAANVDKDDIVGMALAHAGAHGAAAVARVEQLSVHSSLPHVQGIRRTPVARQLVLERHTKSAAAAQLPKLYNHAMMIAQGSSTSNTET